MSEAVKADPAASARASAGLPDETKAAIVQAMEAMRDAAPEDGEPEEQAPPEPTDQAAETDPAGAQPAPEPAAEPPDARFAAAWQKLQEQAQSVEEKSRQLRALEARAGKIDGASAKYQADRIAAVKELIGGYLGTEDESAIQAEMSSLYEDWTGHILGVKSGGSRPTEISALRRELAEHKRLVQEAESAREREKLEGEQKRQLETGTQQCESYVTENRERYPHLVAGADAYGERPGAILMRFVAEANAKGQSQRTIEEIATQANDWFANLAAKLSGQPPASERGQQATTQRQVPQKQAPRRTLPTTRATEVPARQPREYNPDHQAARSDAWRQFQQIAKRPPDD